MDNSEQSCVSRPQRISEASKVELVGASYIGLKAVVDFLYSGELSLDGGNINYVLETAHLPQGHAGTVHHGVVYITGGHGNHDYRIGP